MQYVAPRLTRLGSVAGITGSDIKCSFGNDFGHGVRWAHPNSPPFTHWSHNNEQQTPAEIIRANGNCQWVEFLRPPQ
jgi:hypothetical protein